MQRTSRGRIFTSALGMACFLPALFGVGNAQLLAVAVGFLVLCIWPREFFARGQVDTNIEWAVKK